MIDLQDIWTAIDRAYESMAELQYQIANKSRISGDITIYDKSQIKSAELLMYIEALKELNLNIAIVQNRIIERIYNNIKALTKDIRRWD